MQVLPVDLTSLVATILGISIVLVPVMGLTARFAFKPVVEALAKIFEDRNADETLRMLERRVELQEHELNTLHTTVRHLVEAKDFERQLSAPTPPAALSTPTVPDHASTEVDPPAS